MAINDKKFDAYVCRDIFARGEYRRSRISNVDSHLECVWCGQRPKKLYSYAWENDDKLISSIRPTLLFCNFECFRPYCF